MPPDDFARTFPAAHEFIARRFLAQAPGLIRTLIDLDPSAPDTAAQEEDFGRSVRAEWRAFERHEIRDWLDGHGAEVARARRMLAAG